MKRYKCGHKAPTTEQKRRHNLRARYGLELQDWEILKIKTTVNGKCILCLRRKASVVDHDHASGEVRGYICRSCNRGLGLFFDCKHALMRAALYVTYPPARSALRCAASRKRRC